MSETSAGAEAEAVAAPVDRRAAIAALEERFRATSLRTNPFEHAIAAYRLGLAYAELPPGEAQEGLRRALACYDVAARVFNPALDPVEHARVLNAAGAAHRALGDRARAGTLFEQAAQLFSAGEHAAERAAALNNLALVRAETGQFDDAIDVAGEAVAAFDPGTAEGRRGRAAALHTRGSARAGPGTPEALLAALGDFDDALDAVAFDEAPYHHALVHHTIGVTRMALAGAATDQRQRMEHARAAAVAFDESLRVFTRSALPLQHAMAKHNLGLAHVALGGIDHARHALACFEDAVAVLDVRLHGDAWRQAYASLTRVEAELAGSVGQWTRTRHFVVLAAGLDERERVSMLRERVLRLVELPPPRGPASLTELAVEAATLDPELHRAVLADLLHILIELPADHLDVGVRALVGARDHVGDDDRERMDVALDQAVSDALVGPQRVRVRDMLYALGFERP